MAIASFTFVHSTRRVVYGWDSLGKLPDLAREHGAKRAALVIDEYFTKTDLAGRIVGLLREATGSDVPVYAVPAQEPDTASVEACAATLAQASPDFIVAVGGGSALDTAKVARMLLANPGPAEGIAGFGKRMNAHASVLVALPTTAGTGSEVSESAVVGKDGLAAKLIYRSQDMTPTIALLDPALSVSAPARVTAYAGYDAVTHAVESYISRMSSPMTDPYAYSAMELLGRWLPIAYAEPANREARGACLIASMQAAIAFNSANLGLAHAISGPLGAQQHVAHGLGNALAMPYVMRFNEASIGAKAEAISRCFGGPTASAALSRLRHQLGLDLSLDDFVKTEADRGLLAEWSLKSGQVRMNPRETTADDMRGIIEAMRTPTGGRGL
jgi:alcohol dehydrogenase class IV